jgi:16S rRNA (guanine966-N2)-methyltransferase
MRIVGGRWRGRALLAPPGTATRPTSDRVRQALFDMLWHAPWGGRAAVEDAHVLDAFAGTGALGLEALSRGAAHATFMETAAPARTVLRRNVAAMDAPGRVLDMDATAPSPGSPCNLVFLDPPYRRNLVPLALTALTRTGWIAPDALIVAETARDDPAPCTAPLAVRGHGVALLTIWRRT